MLVAVAVIATVWQYANAGGHHGGGGHGYAHSFAHFHGPVVGPAEPVHVGHGHGHGHAIDYVVSTVRYTCKEAFHSRCQEHLRLLYQTT